MLKSLLFFVFSTILLIFVSASFKTEPVVVSQPIPVEKPLPEITYVETDPAEEIVSIDKNLYNNFTNIVLKDEIQQTTYAPAEVECLAQNIYHEARNDMIAGQFAVADVVLNRVEDKRYPNSICDVVHQGPVYESWQTKKTPDPNDAIFFPVKHKCQFSWYCDGIDDDIKESLAYEQAKIIATIMVSTKMFRGLTEGSTHYHAHYVNPKWAKTKYPIGTIGLHKFYKWL